MTSSLQVESTSILVGNEVDDIKSSKSSKISRQDSHDSFYEEAKSVKLSRKQSSKSYSLEADVDKPDKKEDDDSFYAGDDSNDDKISVEKPVAVPKYQTVADPATYKDLQPTKLQ